MKLMHLMIKILAMENFKLLYCAEFEPRVQNEKHISTKKSTPLKHNEENERKRLCDCHRSEEELVYSENVSLDQIKNKFDVVFEIYKEELEKITKEKTQLLSDDERFEAMPYVPNANNSNSFNDIPNHDNLPLNDCESSNADLSFNGKVPSYDSKKDGEAPLILSERLKNNGREPHNNHISHIGSKDDENPLDFSLKRQDNSQTVETLFFELEDENAPLDLSLRQKDISPIIEKPQAESEIDEIPLDLSLKVEGEKQSRKGIAEENQEETVPLPKRMRKTLDNQNKRVTQEDSKKYLTEKEALKMIEERIINFFKNTILIEVDIYKLIDMLKFLDDYEFKKDESFDIFLYISEFSDENDKILQVLVHGLTSFLISIKEKEAKSKANSELKILGFFYMMKELSKEIMKITTKNCKSATSCNYLILRPKYVFILNLLHEVFLEVAHLWEGYELNLILYRLLIFAELRFKYYLIKFKDDYSCYKTWLNFSFNPIFNVIFILDTETTHSLILEAKVLVSEENFLQKRFNIKESAFFIGKFDEIFNLQQKRDLIKKYETVLNFFRNEYLKKFKMNKSHVAKVKKVFSDVKKALKIKNSKQKIFSFTAKRKLRCEFKIFYMFYICSRTIDFYKIMHISHFDWNIYTSDYSALDVLVNN